MRLTDIVKKAINREVKVPVSVSITNVRVPEHPTHELELYHDAQQRYRREFLDEYQFLYGPFSIPLNNPIANEIYQLLQEDKKARFDGDIILAGNRLLSFLLQEETRATLAGKFRLGDKEFDLKFNVKSWPMTGAPHYVYAVELRKS